MNLNVDIDIDEVVVNVEMEDLADAINRKLLSSDILELLKGISIDHGTHNQGVIHTPTMADVQKFEIIKTLFENKTLSELQHLASL